MERWAVGSLAVIDGLSKAPGQLLNGRLAEVWGRDTQTGHLRVRLNPEDPPAEWSSVAPEHLRPAAVAVAAGGAAAMDAARNSSLSHTALSLGIRSIAIAREVDKADGGSSHPTSHRHRVKWSRSSRTAAIYGWLPS